MCQVNTCSAPNGCAKLTHVDLKPIVTSVGHHHLGCGGTYHAISIGGLKMMKM